MATETLRPNAAGDVTDWTANGAATVWECVDEASADDDTTRAQQVADVSNKDFLVNLGSTALTTERIDSVALTLRMKVGTGTACALNYLWKENGTQTVGGSITGLNSSTYTDVTETRTVRPSDGGAWTTSDLNALQIGCRRVGDLLTSAIRCTQAFVVVTYSYRKSVSGVQSFNGVLVRKTRKFPVGVLTFSGLLHYKLSRLLSAALSFSGALTPRKVALVALAGVVSFAGGLSRRVSKFLFGAVSFAGSLARFVRVLRVGALSFVGALARTKIMHVAVAGVVSFAGAVNSVYLAAASLYRKLLTFHNITRSSDQ